MSTKKKKATGDFDVLGEAHLPGELFPDLGDNYGLDGFPDMEYGGAVLDQLFDESELSGVPDGVTGRDPGKMSDNEFFEDGTSQMDPEPDLVPGDKPDAAWFAEEGDGQDGMQLDEAMKEAGLNDLDWLELNEQDPDRLPETPTSIPELEEAWGVDRRTDGFELQGNTQDLEEVRYREAVANPRAPSYRLSTEELGRVVRKAMRRSAMGHPLKEILVEAAKALGDEAHRVRQAMELVKNDHGLAGNVFIRAAAYPGLHQGKDWSQHLRRAKSARYILVDAKTLKGSSFIQGGRCTVTKKQAVLEVPWDDAFQHYKPVLTGSGYKVANGDPRRCLQAAFRSSPEPLARPSSQLPHHVAPADRVSTEEAKRRFAAEPRPERQVIDKAAARAAEERKAAWVRVNTWVEAGLVPLDEAMSVVNTGVDGPTLLHRVAALVVRSKGASAFSGLPNDARPPRATKAEVQAALASWKPPKAIDVAHRQEKAARQQAVETLERWGRAGFLSSAQVEQIRGTNLPATAMLRVASKFVLSPREAGTYTGVRNDRRVSAERDPAALKAGLDQNVAERVAAQQRIDELARDKRAQTTRAARKISAAEALVAEVKKAIDRGVRGAPLRDFIRRTIPAEHRNLAAKTLLPLLQKTGAHLDTPKESRQYQGASFQPHQGRTASEAPTPRPKEADAAVQYCKEAMHEGVAGTELDSLLRAKFSTAVLKAAARRIKQARAEHEGGAGFMYVEANTYASTTGTKGCEEGGLRHRANRLRFVVAMDRCGSCALATRRSNGSRVCRVYNKELITAADMPDEMKNLRLANIEAAEMTEEERTASYFAPTYDPGEFDLSNNPLNDIKANKKAKHEEVNFTFGGIEF
jgi:hypothetical protein